MSGHPGKRLNVGGFITMAVALMLSVGFVVADQSPGSCNATGLQLTTVREKTLVTLGDVNRYTVSITNNDNPVAGSLACDTEDVLVIFCCPDVDGRAPSEDPAFDPDNPGPLCTVLSDGFGDNAPTDRDDFPANFGTRIYTTQECVIDGFFVSGSSKRANVKVQAGFDDLTYGRLHDVPGDSPLNREDVLGVTVVECAVQVDKAVACDGANYVDQTLVSDNGDGTNGCYGWNSHDSDGDGSLDGAEPLNVQYRVSNVGDPGSALFDCQIVESNGNIINIPIVIGDLADGETSSPFTIPGSCDESLDDGEPDTATVTCSCIDPNSPDFDPTLTTSALDRADFDCQTPSLTISKNCTDDLDINGQFPVDITVTNNGDATLINCVVTDTAVADDATCPGDGAGTDVPLTPVGGFDGSLAPGESKQFTGAVDVLALEFANNAQVVCEIADENGNPVIDPNTQQAKTITRDDCDTCETTCEVELDKQVSCDGKDVNDPTKVWYDVTGADDDDVNSNIGQCYGWNGFDTGSGDQAAEGIDVRYVVSNNGQTSLYSCEVTDTNGAVTGPLNLATIAPGGSDTLDVGNSCSGSLDLLEPDTATVSCLCVDDPQTSLPPVEDEDTASFDCQSPGLDISKTCVDDLDVNGQFPVSISVTNTGDATLINCVVTDTAVADDATCPGVGSGTDVPLTAIGGFSGSLAPGETKDFTGALDVLSLGGFANNAKVVCEIADENGNPVIDPNTQQPKEITRDDCDTCVTTCEVELDKQVSCDGKAVGDPTKVWYDVTGSDDDAANTQTGSCLGWNGFDNGSGTQGAETVDIRYVISNKGDADLFTCELIDSNGAVTGPINVGDIASGSSNTQDIPLSCSESLDDLEPDTAIVSCICADPASTLPPVQDDDTASFDCQTPNLTINKDCVDDLTTTDQFPVNVIVTNTGDAKLINCTVVDTAVPSDDTCPGSGPGVNVPLSQNLQENVGYTLLPGQTLDFSGLVDVLALEFANTAQVVCQIADENDSPVLDPDTGQPKTITRDDCDLCRTTCEVELDKQISCDGKGLNDPTKVWYDVTGADDDDANTVIGRCLGWNGFDPGSGNVPAEDIDVRYVASNNGLTGLYSCELTDSNGAVTGPIQVGNIATGGSDTQDIRQSCSDDLDLLEPNTATISCLCADDPTTTIPPVEDEDSAEFECQTPDLTINKDCVDELDSSDRFPVNITVTNAGDATLINCVVSDAASPTDIDCPTVGSVDVPLTPVGVFDGSLAPAASQDFTGAVDVLALDGFANSGAVTCEIADENGNPVLDPATGQPKTITRNDCDTCNTTCAVELDKQVSCDGKALDDPSKTWYDVTSGDDNAAHTLIGECWGWNAFDTGDGTQTAESIDVRYVISNDGLATLYQCEVTDSNGAVTGPINVGNIPSGGSSTHDVRPSCSESLDDLEPDTGSVSCLCVDDVTTTLIATDDDQASFDCQTPTLRITKVCGAPNADGIDPIDISVFNDGTANLINCQVVDEVYQGSATCGAPGAGDLLNLIADDPFDPASFNLGAGGSVNIDSAVAVIADSCNRATVVCEIADHNGNPVVDPATGQNKTIRSEDDSLCEPPPCMVEVDKQVSCDGGLTWLDQGLQTSNGDGNNSPCVGWNAFIAPDGSSVPAEQILVRYQAHNDSAITLYDCTLSESNGGLPGVGGIGNLAPGETQQFYFPDGSGADCTAGLAGNEPDTATLTCFCSDARDVNFQASATDGANFDCQTPGLEVIKTCGTPDANLGIVPFEIIITNTSVDGATLANCTVSDEIFLDDDTCPAGPAGTGTDIPLNPNTIANLPAGSSAVVINGDTACPTMGPACNTATVTCDIVGSVDPTTGGPKTISKTADDLCQPCGNGCLSRTPGFWGTHPRITEKFLPLVNCGIEINNTFAATAGSSAEDMCWGGRDFKTADTSASQLQLIRQCMAAHLNIAATIAGTGNCDSSYPNISGIINSCCEDVCTVGPSGGDIGDSNCIALLDAFNNSNDTLDPYGDFIRPGPAESGECREANGNGYVNPGRNLGPRR